MCIETVSELDELSSFVGVVVVPSAVSVFPFGKSMDFGMPFPSTYH